MKIILFLLSCSYYFSYAYSVQDIGSYIDADDYIDSLKETDKNTKRYNYNDMINKIINHRKYDSNTKNIKKNDYDDMIDKIINHRKYDSDTKNIKKIYSDLLKKSDNQKFYSIPLSGNDKEEIDDGDQYDDEDDQLFEDDKLKTKSKDDGKFIKIFINGSNDNYIIQNNTYLDTLKDFDKKCGQGLDKFCINQYQLSLRELSKIKDFKSTKNLNNIVTYLVYINRSGVKFNNVGVNILLDFLNEFIKSRHFILDNFEAYDRIVFHVHEILYRINDNQYFNAILHCIINFVDMFTDRFLISSNINHDFKHRFILHVLDVYKVLYLKTQNKEFINLANRFLNKIHDQSFCEQIDENFNILCIYPKQFLVVKDNFFIESKKIFTKLYVLRDIYTKTLVDGIKLFVFNSNPKFEYHVRKMIPNKLFYDNVFEYDFANKILMINLNTYQDTYKEVILNVLNNINQTNDKRHFDISYDDDYLAILCKTNLLDNVSNICNYKSKF